MRHLRSTALFFTALISAIACQADITGERTEQIMRRVFDWQVDHPWSTQHPIEHRWGTRGWVQGAFLTGVMEAYRATGDEAYVRYASDVSQKNGWKLGARKTHADDHIVGQTYLELHQLAPTSEKLEHTRAILTSLLDEPRSGREFWSWCDALYMSPPTFTKLAVATKERGFLEAMDRWYWESCDALFDQAEGLFYRDKRFVDPVDGRKIFWSRGNGWVLAGLARLLDVLPEEDSLRPKYVALFQRMAARLLALQPGDGLWRADLLRPSGDHGEVSGSAFFCYALAWGINRGHLTDPEAREKVLLTWKALVACVDADGKLGWVQPIGFAPDAYHAETSQEYGAGAFLAAGSQIIRLQQPR